MVTGNQIDIVMEPLELHFNISWFFSHFDSILDLYLNIVLLVLSLDLKICLFSAALTFNETLKFLRNNFRMAQMLNLDTTPLFLGLIVLYQANQPREAVVRYCSSFCKK